MVVCDVDPDVEGEAGGGSIDVEERNVMARTAASRADVVFAVGGPSLKGMHGLVRVITDLVGPACRPERIVPVINRSPRSPPGPGRPGHGARRPRRCRPPAAAWPAPSTCPSATSRATSATAAGSRRSSARPLAGAFDAVLDRVPERTLDVGAVRRCRRRIRPARSAAGRDEEAAV